jgi:hypothetical protein
MTLDLREVIPSEESPSPKEVPSMLSNNVKYMDANRYTHLLSKEDGGNMFP